MLADGLMTFPTETTFNEHAEIRPHQLQHLRLPRYPPRNGVVETRNPGGKFSMRDQHGHVAKLLERTNVATGATVQQCGVAAAEPQIATLMRDKDIPGLGDQ